MKPQSSKSKGRKAENKVAEILQEWWRTVEPGAVFMRTPGSGGWSNAKAAGLKTRGDVTYDPTTCSSWPFSVEVKHRKTITPGAVERFVGGNCSSIDKHWKQCCKAASSDGVLPLLVFRGNRMKWWAAIIAPANSPGAVERRTMLLSSFLEEYAPYTFLCEPYVSIAKELDRWP